jgi:Arylsulfotransferase (ASST)/Secretion system C-terminal sorting domain
MRLRSIAKWTELTALVIGLSIANVYALGPTLPSDMIDYSSTGSLEGCEGYLFLDPSPLGGVDNGVRYILTLDGQGEIVYYRKPADNESFNNWQPVDSAGVYSFGVGNTNQPGGLRILDQGLNLLDSLDGVNPFNDSLRLDSHEFHMEADGSKWSLWRHDAIVDMSEYVPGGNPQAIVTGHDIEKWDAEGNLVWAWRSHDHIDQLPYTGVTNPASLTRPEIEYLHVNSFDLTPDGDILVSARKMSVIFKIDYASGNVEWILGGGPLNQFDFVGDAGEHPVGFVSQHDARMLDDVTMTVFDNGTLHAIPRAFAREYTLDLENMEAELIWYYTDPIEIFAADALGSYRRLPDNQHLIGWGASDLTAQVSWLDQDDNLLMDLNFNPGPGSNISVYRANWSPFPPISDLPIVSEVIHLDQDQVEFVCNWWGHEDEVEIYELYVGSEWEPSLEGTTDSGVIYYDGYDPNTGYVVRCRALDGNGIPISDYSPRLLINDQYLGVDEESLDISSQSPAAFTLLPAYPNPFNPSSTVSVNLSESAELKLGVYNVLGEQVALLADELRGAGHHEFTFNGQNLASGLYLVRASVPGQFDQVQKVMLLR